MIGLLSLRSRWGLVICKIKNQLGGHKKSSKQRKAEKLIEVGRELRIGTKPDFIQLVGD
jgi:hypothetical protein